MDKSSDTIQHFQFATMYLVKWWICGACIMRYWIHVAGSWVQDPGSSLQNPGSRIRILGPGSRILGPGSRILDPGSWIHDPGSRVLDPVLRLQDPRSSIQGAGCRLGTGLMSQNQSDQVIEKNIMFKFIRRYGYKVIPLGIVHPKSQQETAPVLRGSQISCFLCPIQALTTFLRSFFVQLWAQT